MTAFIPSLLGIFTCRYFTCNVTHTLSSGISFIRLSFRKKSLGGEEGVVNKTLVFLGFLLLIFQQLFLQKFLPFKSIDGSVTNLFCISVESCHSFP